MKKCALILMCVCLLLIQRSQSLSAQTFQDFVGRVNAAPQAERPAIVDSFMTVNTVFPRIEDDTLAHLIYRGPAGTAQFAGDMTSWSPVSMTQLPATDFWYRTEKYAPDTRLDYKFILNGSNWILDPRNPKQSLGGFGANSELRMPQVAAAPEVQLYSIPHGTFRDTTFYSATLGNSRAVKIYLPPGYSESGTDSFAVALFHDGLDYINFAAAANVLDYLIAQQKIAPIIAVFVPAVNRTPEYAGTQTPQFALFIVNEVMPVIDARYRTKKNPASRAVIGASNGGNISLYIGYTYPQTFGNIGAYSSNIQSSILDGFQSSAKLPLKLYLDIGKYDISVLIPLVKSLVPVLQSKGYPYKYKEWNDGHSWGNWREHIDESLEYFFPAAPLAAPKEKSTTPKTFKLGQNYPNPFNPKTVVSYQLLVVSDVQLKVFDALGREVRTLANAKQVAGNYAVNFDAVGLASGTYFYRLQAGTESETRKMMLVK